VAVPKSKSGRTRLGSCWYNQDHRNRVCTSSAPKHSQSEICEPVSVQVGACYRYRLKRKKWSCFLEVQGRLECTIAVSEIDCQIAALIMGANYRLCHVLLTIGIEICDCKMSLRIAANKHTRTRRKVRRDGWVKCAVAIADEADETEFNVIIGDDVKLAVVINVGDCH
jgi:hypothetical protein